MSGDLTGLCLYIHLCLMPTPNFWVAIFWCKSWAFGTIGHKPVYEIDLCIFLQVWRWSISQVQSRVKLLSRDLTTWHLKEEISGLSDSFDAGLSNRFDAGLPNRFDAGLPNQFLSPTKSESPKFNCYSHFLFFIFIFTKQFLWNEWNKRGR